MRKTKLNLTRTTIRNLTESDLGGARGGIDPTGIDNTAICPSANCPTKIACNTGVKGAC